MTNPTTTGRVTPLGKPGSSPISLFFGALFIAVIGYFLFWGADYVQGNHLLLFVLATLFGVFMAFNIGGNDVANAFGTSVGAGTLTIKQALIIAAVFEVSGAIIAGGHVTQTIRGGIVDLGAMDVAPMDFVYIMMSALIAAALWLLFATKRGYPVSTTHSIIGAIVGSSIALGVLMQGGDAAFELVQWSKIGEIAISWVLSPLLGGVVAYLLYQQIKKHILSYNERAEDRLEALREQKRAHKVQHQEGFDRLSELQKVAYTQAMARDQQLMGDRDFDPQDLESDYYKGLYHLERQREDIASHRALENWVPLVAAIGALVVGSMLLFKGLKNLDLGLTTLNSYLLLGMIGVGVWMSTYVFARSLRDEPLGRATFIIFSWMQVFTACGFAFSHGANDIANAIGPFAAILDVLRTGATGSQAAIPTPAMIAFGVALIVGLWFIGKEVIQTVGHNLTELHPASGFSAELAAAAVVMLASVMGLPVSSTHILIGAVLGIGLVNRQTNWGLMKPIALAWVITIPAAALLSAGAFLALRNLF